MITRSVAKRNAKLKELPILPPEIIDMILLWKGDVKLVNGLGRFSLMKKFLPATFWDVIEVSFRKIWPEYDPSRIEANIKNLKSKFTRGCGEIGRRTRLRIWRREAWGFESLHPYSST